MSMELDASHLMSVTAMPEVLMMRGEGSWLYDQHDGAYLDFTQGWAVNSLGHSSEVVRTASSLQQGQLANSGPGLHNLPKQEFSNLLAEVSGLDEVFFCNSGAEANEGAIKLARKWGSLHKDGAYKIIVAEGAFHGRTVEATAASDKPELQALYHSNVDNFIRVPFNDIDAVADAIDDDVAAVLIEPIQGEAGVFPATPDYLQQLRRLTRNSNILLMLDEVQTGVGRTGNLFAHQYTGIKPDVMTLGKGLGGGVGVAALLATTEASCFEHGEQGSTFGGNAAAMAAGKAVVRTIADPRFLKKINYRSDYLISGLTQLANDKGHGEIRGRGLLLAMELKDTDANQVVKNAFRKGLIINAPRPDTLRFMPALNVEEKDIDQALWRLEPLI